MLIDIFYFSWFSVFISIVFGLIFGSFSTFLGYRLFNKNVKLTGARSICSNCGHKLSSLDLIPIISFLALKGKCRYCHKNIPFWYILAEIMMVLSFLIAVNYFNGINFNTILMWIICFCLITQSIIDYRVMLSSDILHLIEFFSVFVLSKNMHHDFYEIIINYAMTMLIFFILSVVMKKIIKKDCIGIGDIKLFVILSPLFSYEKMSIFFALCGAFGIIFYVLQVFLQKKKQFTIVNFRLILKNKNQPFAFIPAIFFAFLLAFYF